MTIQQRERLRKQLVIHEGMRFRPYKCPAGRITIGCGRNLDDNGITEEEAYYLLDNDISRCIRELTNTFEWFPDLDDIRQRVWVDLAFNLGMPRLKGFHKAIKAMQVGDTQTAAAELMDSQWSRQVGKRAKWLCDALVSGVEPGRY